MNALREYLSRLKTFLQSLISKFEESALFERLVIRYENLDPRSQKRLRLTANIAVLLGLFLLITLPLLSALQSRSELDASRALLARMKAFNTQGKTVYQPAPAPPGWRPLPANNIEELETALRDYLISKGVPEDLTELERQGSQLTLSVTSANIRQLTDLLFQLEGWYPGVKVPKLKTQVNADNKEAIDFELSVVYDPAAAQKIIINPNSAPPIPRSGGYSARNDVSSPDRSRNESSGSNAQAPSESARSSSRRPRPPSYRNERNQENNNNAPEGEPLSSPEDNQPEFEPPPPPPPDFPQEDFPEPPPPDFDEDLPPPPAFEDEEI